jgi:hypothetical protein
MKLIFCFLLISSHVSAQNNTFESVNQRREKITKTGTVVLGSWALINIGAGLVGKANASGEQRQFHRANAIWGGVNLGLTGLTYILGRNKKYNSPFEILKEQNKTEKLFLLNTALDAGYFVYGLYTKERASRYTGEKRDRLLGAGNSLLLQSSFLVLFDGILYVVHTRNGSKLDKVLQNLTFTANSGGVGLAYNF